MDHWGPLERANAWYSQRFADSATKPLLDAYVRDILPRDRTYYPKTFANDLARLSGELTPAFLDAAARAVHYGYISSDDAIAHGALDDLDGFETVIDTAVEVLTPSEQEKAAAAETHLDIVNDVYSDDYAQHLAENDDGYTASEFLKSYVERIREKRGWELIAQHRHAEMLRPYWLRALANRDDEHDVDAAELAGAFQAAYGTPDEDHLWFALLKAWDEQYRDALERRILAGSVEPDAEQAALACLVEHAPELVAQILARLVERKDHNRLISIARGLAYLRRGRTRDGAKHIDAANDAAAKLPDSFREICDAELAMASKSEPNLSQDAQHVLGTVAEPTDEVRALRLAVDEHIPLPIEDDVQWALGAADDPSIAVDAIEAAIRHGMSAEIDAALDHRFAHVAARALAAIASPLAAPLPQNLLDLAAHKASPVRRALVDELKRKPDLGHRAALLRLSGDQWSRHSQDFGRDSDDYPIAQTALAALADIAPLGAVDNAALLAIATDTSDPDVRNAIFDLLAKFGDPNMQNRLFGLAVEPGRARLRSSAAYALLRAGAELDQSLIEAITPLLATRYEPVAGVLAVLLGWRGTVDAIRAAAETLAANRKRRALLLLMAWTLADRDRIVAEEIAAMLPAGHRGVAWALGEKIETIDEGIIADLGDPAICAEVLSYMRLGSSEENTKQKRRSRAKKKR